MMFIMESLDISIVDNLRYPFYNNMSSIYRIKRQIMNTVSRTVID